MDKRRIIIIVSIVAIVAAITFRIIQTATNNKEEETKTSDKTCFQFSDHKIIGYYYNLCGKVVNIPKYIHGAEVNVIGESAFENMQITSVTLPETVTKIEQYAFNRNELTEVIIPEQVKYIGKNAFSNNKISKLDIKPVKITMNETPFNNNQLEDKYAFIYNMNDGIDKTDIISYAGKNRDNVKIPTGVTNIGPYTFSDMEIKKITLNNDLEVIGNGAFIGNSFSEITIPSSVTYFGDNVLDYDISKVNIENKDKIDDFGYYGMQTFEKDVLNFKGKTTKTEKEIQIEKGEDIQ